MPASSPLADWINALADNAVAAHCRHLLVIAGSETWSRATATQVLDALPDRASLWLGERAPANRAELASVRPDALLGREWDIAVLDAFSGLRPNMLGAVGGVLRGGGLLLLLAPPLSAWDNFRDPDYQRLDDSLTAAQPRSAYFWRRLRGLVECDEQVVIVEENQPLSAMPLSLASRLSLRLSRPPLDDLTTSTIFAEQQDAIEAIVRTLRGRARRPLVLLADRGRGKSAALGLAGAQWLREHGGDIVVTAPRWSACANVFYFAAHALDRQMQRDGELISANGAMRFIPPDQLIAEKPPANVLLVDEAAAIPAALLQQLFAIYPRIVFATTVHGYEGSGRGFEIRFLPWLQTVAPQWRRVILQQPLRWARHDPLENWLYRALLLDAAPQVIDTNDGDETIYRKIDRAELLADENLLRQIFGLLVQAHYRTAPDDLRYLLDAPNVSVWVAQRRDIIVATLLIATEGELPAPLHAAIIAGVRRPRGHLLPQSLAFHCGCRAALTWRCARVVRIAVAPSLQRRGIGRKVLACAQRDLLANDFDIIGVSFAASAEVVAFWSSMDFMPMRIGVRRETGSGYHSALLVKVLSARTQNAVRELAARWRAQLPWLLTDYLRDLDAPLVRSLLMSALPRGAEPSMALTAQQLDDIEMYTSGRCPLENCLVAVKVLCIARAAELARLDTTQLSVLVLRVLQHRAWADIVARLSLRGHTDAEQMVRAAVTELLGRR